MATHKERRLGLIPVRPEFLSDWLGIGTKGSYRRYTISTKFDKLHLDTDRMEFRSGNYSEERDCILLLVFHPDLPECAMGSMLPLLETTFYEATNGSS